MIRLNGLVLCSLLIIGCQMSEDAFRPPIIAEEKEQLLVARSTPLRLSCQSSRVPTPKVTWFYNNQTLSSGTNVTVNETKLTVHWVTESGTYECLATNGVDSASKQFVVTLEADHFAISLNWLKVWVLSTYVGVTMIFVIFHLLTKVYKIRDSNADDRQILFTPNSEDWI